MTAMTMYKVVFWFCLSVSIALIVIGFCLPPKGVIDGSVLTAVGELFGFATLSQVPTLLKERRLHMTHGNTSLTIESGEGDVVDASKK